MYTYANCLAIHGCFYVRDRLYVAILNVAVLQSHGQL
jgi:hypothetical protein